MSYKGFDKDMRCREFQFEIGKTYTHEGSVEACKSGFHACEYPLDVFRYYPPGISVYATVEQTGEISKADDDTKVASSVIAVKASIDVAGLVKAAIEWTRERCQPIDPQSPSSATGTQGASSATGTRGASSATGERGASSATGTRGASSATGTQGASSATGTQGASSATGHQGASSATGERGASSATGTQGASSATGDQGASITTGPFAASSATGAHSVAVGAGTKNKARGANGCALFLVFRNDEGEILHAKAAIVGKTKGIKADVWYELDDAGKFVEVGE